ncbi:uncharacterized protein V1516DRAFT_687771 [Lipomyces oligophaga]|uniref:uncharacterized protein n=1 Tax=Lipomyces oligophaga TaxID=45792 RepID=UPI0034CD6B60
MDTSLVAPGALLNGTGNVPSALQPGISTGMQGPVVPASIQLASAGQVSVLPDSSISSAGSMMHLSSAGASVSSTSPGLIVGNPADVGLAGTNASELRTLLQKIGAQLLPIYDDNSTGGEEDIVLYRPTEESWNLWLKEQKMYCKWNTHKRANYRKANKRIQAGALDFKYVYLCNHAKRYTSQHNPDVPPEKRRRGKETIKVGCHAKIVARQYTDANQIEIRYWWRHNGHAPPRPIDCLVDRDDAGRQEWLRLRVCQLYTMEPFMDLALFTVEEVASFEQDPILMSSLPEIFHVLHIKPSSIYNMVREQLVQSSNWPDSPVRKKVRMWQELFSELNSTLGLFYQKNGALDDVPLSSLRELLVSAKAQNRRFYEVLFPSIPPSLVGSAGSIPTVSQLQVQQAAQVSPYQSQALSPAQPHQSQQQQHLPLPQAASQHLQDNSVDQKSLLLPNHSLQQLHQSPHLTASQGLQTPVILSPVQTHAQVPAPPPPPRPPPPQSSRQQQPQDPLLDTVSVIQGHTIHVHPQIGYHTSQQTQVQRGRTQDDQQQQHNASGGDLQQPSQQPHTAATTQLMSEQQQQHHQQQQHNEQQPSPMVPQQHLAQAYNAMYGQGYSIPTMLSRAPNV